MDAITIVRSRWIFCSLVFIGVLIATNCFAAAPQKFHPGGQLELSEFSGAKPLANGIEISSGQAIIQITALRDDVIRVRIGRDGVLPEDASWAVLPSARQQRATVIPEKAKAAVGFRTKNLRVQVERATLRLVVSDLEGNILQEDAPAWPAEFHDKSFRIYKKMPLDEHYFGLGDKAGPLDRRNQAFTMWNTDAYDFRSRPTRFTKGFRFF